MLHIYFFCHSNVGIPKLYVEAGRKRHPVTNKLPDSVLFNDQIDTIKNIYVPPPEVRDVIDELDDKEYEDELNDEQREVMEDIWLKADEMGM